MVKSGNVRSLVPLKVVGEGGEGVVGQTGLYFLCVSPTRWG